jgi:hypothetical protein
MEASVFVEKASQDASDATVLKGDPRADELLAAARASIYHWPKDFGGFSASVQLSCGMHSWEGTLRIQDSRHYLLDLGDCPEKQWAKFQVEEMVAHREHPERSRMSSRTGCRLGDYDSVYGQQIFFLGDKMSSYYRIKDSRITQIFRSYGGQEFVIHLDDHLNCDGFFAASVYSAYYKLLPSQDFHKVENYFDRYTNFEGVYLPQERRVTEASSSGVLTRTLVLGDFQPLTSQSSSTEL